MRTRENRVTQIIAHLFCGFIALCAILPFILLITSSITDEAWATQNGYSFFPGELSLEAYKYIGVQWDMIGRAYFMTLIVTVIGTTVSVLITTLFAYGISQTNIPGMRTVNFLLIFTMLFNGGLVATYYMYVHYLSIKDTIWALLIPSLLLNAFNVILVKNYISYSIPGALKEAATIDGASEFKIFAKIIMPLSLPIIATIGLMTGLSYWNDWQNGLYYLSGRGGAHLNTIQIILNNINENIQVLQQNASQAQAIGANTSQLPSTTIRMAIAALGILPILVLYPFFQRYFVKGITLGGVKE
ncbi:carbohydrate ABC transporter permease [Paenibacillus graminis]|uniref:Sugar ABC transporter permease n=1 Tax=Paenibacillus graminis TaxID=189425 RepID=A0A089NMP1_9BACL|nr:carbohydrate ABC transporter permease [Paenibacillus graminis]AIQ70319.1 sugar ABC transporter permease [Paenibacillus graminis]